MNALVNKRRNGWHNEITEAERDGYVAYHTMWKIEKAAKQSEVKEVK